MKTAWSLTKSMPVAPGKRSQPGRWCAPRRPCAIWYERQVRRELHGENGRSQPDIKSSIFDGNSDGNHREGVRLALNVPVRKAPMTWSSLVIVDWNWLERRCGERGERRKAMETSIKKGEC